MQSSCDLFSHRYFAGPGKDCLLGVLTVRLTHQQIAVFTLQSAVHLGETHSLWVCNACSPDLEGVALGVPLGEISEIALDVAMHKARIVPQRLS